jgi:hypothetical protein
LQQKFATGSYGVGIGRAWCSRKACEICSSLVQKKKLKKIYFSSHKLPKQQSTSFWSQGILGVNACPLSKHLPHDSHNKDFGFDLRSPNFSGLFIFPWFLFLL